jgi:EVE domain
VVVNQPFEINLSILPDSASRGSMRVYLTRPGARVSGPEGSEQAGRKERPATRELAPTQALAGGPKTWIFQASPRFSNVKGAVLSIEEPVCLVHQFRKEIGPGDRVYLWECGPRAGIIALAEVAEAPRSQPEPAEQLPFIRESEKFAGDRLRVKLRIVKRIAPAISRTYLMSRPELAGLSILRCARGTNFRVTPEQAEVLDKVVKEFEAFFPNWNGSREKRIVFAEG